MHRNVAIKIILVVMIVIVTGLLTFAIDEYSSTIDPMLDSTPNKAQQENATKVTAVYGVGSDDYLPMKEEARRHLRPNVRESRSHPSFDLPDAFYFIGGPVFLLLLLRVLWMFLNEFDETRRAEQNLAASERLAEERFVADE